MPKPPADATTGFSLLSQLPGFVAGLVSSAAIAIPLYFKQRRDSAESERRIILAIQQQQQQDAGLAPLIASTMSALSGKEEVLLSRFDELRSQFEAAVRSAEYIRAIPLARPYTAVARAVANEKAMTLLATKTQGLELSEQKLRELHSGLFPDGYELAGQLRTSQVWLGPVGSNADTATFVPPAPSAVPSELDALIQRWNTELPRLRTADAPGRLRAVAEFHHALVSIHPFLDGNGILARLVSTQQLRELLGVNARLVERDPDYIHALQEADSGDIQPLVQYFERSISS